MQYILKKIFLVSLLTCAISASGAVLSPEEALNRATLHNIKLRGAQATSPNLVYTQQTAYGNPGAYIFNYTDGGFVIASALESMPAVLGYSDEGQFSEDTMAPALKAWLEYCVSPGEISSNVFSSTDAAAGRPAIEPMLKTRWAQMAPYNCQLPNTNYATGCVATAMAQIMKYWEYPAVGEGSVNYSYINAYLEEVTNSMDFSLQPFQWGEMLDTYQGEYTEDEALAVGYLMKACGYSTETIYGGSSATQTERAAIALCTYFDYDPSIEYLQRFQFTATEWNDMLYDQLSNVGPVLYTGLSLDGIAHAFVADGYDGKGYFHINWGWNGLSDGYFLLDALTPPEQSTGGAKSGYNFSQGMVVNIMKNAGNPGSAPEPKLTLLGNISATTVSGSASLLYTMSEANPGNIVNNGLVGVTPVFGIKIQNETGAVIEFVEADVVFVGGVEDTVPEMAPGSYLASTLSVEAPLPSSLSEGKYKCTLVWRDASQTGDWRDFVTAPGCHDYVYADVESSGVDIENLPLARFNIVDAEVVGELVMREPCVINFTLTNPTDYELTQSIVPLLYYIDSEGERQLTFMGDTNLATVAPHETTSVLLTYNFEQKSSANLPTTNTPREYLLGAFDYCVLLEQNFILGEYGESYYGDLATVTMLRTSGINSVTDSGLRIKREGDAIRISAEADTQAVEIFGLDGKMAFAEKDCDSEIIISKSALQPGIYIVKITEKGGKEKKLKIII